MKKFICYATLIIMILSTMSFNVVAYSTNTNETTTSTVTYLKDGSYLVTTISEDSSSTRATNTKSGSKTTTYYSATDEALWKATLKGTFSYTGSSATCTAASETHTVYDSSWKITSATATKNGNKAIGAFVAKHYVLGIPIQTIEKSLTITCSASGTLS